VTNMTDAQVGRVSMKLPISTSIPPPHREKNRKATASVSIGSFDRSRTATSAMPRTMNVPPTNHASPVAVRPDFTLVVTL